MTVPDPHSRQGELDASEQDGGAIAWKSPPEPLNQRLSRLKLLFLDVDGVLTDGRIWIMPNGQEVKSFDVKDGFGLKLLMKAGIEVVLVSARVSGAVDARARELGIRHVHQGVSNKGTVLRHIMETLNIKPQEAGAVGDDLADLEMFAEAGLRFAVRDAMPELKRHADFVSTSKGGRGAVREICELILRGKTHNSVVGSSGK